MWTNESDLTMKAAQLAAASLAGTVTIPSPVPATARILVGRDTDSISRTTMPLVSEFYIRVIEFRTPQVIITRFLNLDHVRALKKIEEDTYQATPLILGEELETSLGELRTTLRAANAPREVVLAEAGAIFVSEDTPVLVRIELGTTAAVAADALLLEGEKCSGIPRPVCCPSSGPGAGINSDIPGFYFTGGGSEGSGS